MDKLIPILSVPLSRCCRPFKQYLLSYKFREKNLICYIGNDHVPGLRSAKEILNIKDKRYKKGLL